MNTPQKVLVGLIALLTAYSIFTTIHADKLQRRLTRLESSYQELQTRHRAFAAKMLHALDTSQASIQARMDALRENLGLPAGTVVGLTPAVTEVNSLPRRLTNK